MRRMHRRTLCSDAVCEQRRDSNQRLTADENHSDESAAASKSADWIECLFSELNARR